MNRGCFYSAAALLLLHSIGSSAVVLYVNVNGTNPLPPYADWSTAATNIQDAIDVSGDGDQIWVTNGIYQTGGRVMAGDLTNRIALNKAVTVQSVNGPFETIIQGAFATNGPAAVRCAWLTNGATLEGFTLEGGASRMCCDIFNLQSGGGAWCQSTQSVIANCIIRSNFANSYGGGVYKGNLRNCLLYGNTAYDGGGAYVSVMNNCTVTRNQGTQIAGGCEGGYITNCIVYFNSSKGSSTNYQFGFWSYSCAGPLPAGIGNIGADPQMFDDYLHLAESSPCRGAGTNTVSPTDIYGHSWSNPPSMGCAEWQPEPMVGALGIRISDDGTLAINVLAIGQSPLVCSWRRNGTEIEDGPGFGSVHTTNLVVRNLNLLVGAEFQVVVTNAYGMATSSPSIFPIHCVDSAGANPVPPYSTWATAATNIQDAIDAAVPGDFVLVTNGVYGTGGRSMDGSLTNRVSVDKAVIVISVNGPGSTIIQGAWDPVSTNGPGAVRCVWITNYAALDGFTLCGGATQILGIGGGIWATSTNATIYNCIIATNFAYFSAGGAYSATLRHCTLIGNHARGLGTPPGGTEGGMGGGAVNSVLKNCRLTANFADQNNGGGTLNCIAINCAFTGNRAVINGGAADGGTLLSCTVVNNTSGNTGGYGGAVADAAVTNCIVYGNFNIGFGQTNCRSCTVGYSDADPLPPGAGNLNVDPQLLADGIHLKATSPCIGAGTVSIISGTDIDDQPWTNPPSIGCDEWHPVPVIAVQPIFQADLAAHRLTFNVITAGQSPFGYFWDKDGVPIQDDGHRTNSTTQNLVVNNFGFDDVGLYQVVVSNAFGTVTGAVQVVFHMVDVAGANPVAPYSTWTTAATNIQDAIDIAGPGDIIFVTNGVYATGGKVVAGDLTNRVALDRPVTVTSMNGFAATVIQGAWDSGSANGPGAVRCAYLADGAVLNGFTLQNGATRATSGSSATPLSGGGVLCASANGVVSNCLLTNNAAVYGGGINSGTLNNSLVIGNLATYGGGAYAATLNNCTVVNNFTTTTFIWRGAGTYSGFTRNSIVLGNYDNYSIGAIEDNYVGSGGVPQAASYFYSCTSPTKSGTGNINANPQFLDWFHIATTSPCRGAGSSLYAGGADFDGEPWASPPSMGCDEVVVSNLVGPLSVNVRAYQTNLFVNRIGVLFGIIEGRASRVEWSLGDGPTITNAGATLSHPWTNAGDYTVTFAAFNTDNPGGVSTNLSVHIMPLNAPLLQSALVLSNKFTFQFTGQTDANYTVQYTTNLAPPVAWQSLQSFFISTGQVYQVQDSAVTNGMRFYRVWAQ